jgi:hypothetical protein
MIDMVGVDVDPSKIIRQDIIPRDGACGPATVLNALRFGPPAFQDAYSALPGNSDSEKLASIIATHGSAPSAAIPGQSLFASTGGMWTDDLYTYFSSILGDQTKSLAWTYFEVADRESPAEHLRRVHSLLVLSLEQGVPIIGSINSFAARKQKDEMFQWKGICGHFILIFGVPRQINGDGQGFLFQFIEPGIGKPCEGYVYSETVRPFVAAKSSSTGYIYSETAKQFVPIKGSHESKWIENGFLHVISPSLPLRTQNEPWYARTFLTLDFGLGRFACDGPVEGKADSAPFPLSNAFFGRPT